MTEIITVSYYEDLLLHMRMAQSQSKLTKIWLKVYN